MGKKTASITLENIKCTDGWYELATDVLFDDFKKKHLDLDEDELHDMFYEKVCTIFKYGEYANLTIEVDENLNIVGGKIHPITKQ